MKRIICIANIDWNFSWQRAQIFMSALASNGFKIIFINNTGFAKIKWGDTRRIYKKLFPSEKKVSFPAPDNIKILSPLVFPFGIPFKSFLNEKFFYPKLLYNLINNGFDKPEFIYTFLPTDISTYLIDNIKPKKIIYDYVGDFTAHPRKPPNLAETHNKILERADLVLTDSEKLKCFLQKGNTNAHILHNGVSDCFFKPNTIPLTRTPETLCYFGTITKQTLDFNLINYLAENKYHVTLIGSIKGELPKLHKNIHIKGMLSLNELSKELEGYDVIIFPYLKSNFNDSVMPAKLYQSLATGKPTISINLPLLETEEYKQLLYLARNNHNFIDLLKSLPQTEDLKRIHERQTFAASHHQSLYSESLIQLVNKLNSD